MLRILGHASHACDGLTRRELLTAGALSLLDLEATVPDQTGRRVHISHGGKVVRQALA
jgi:hypothetical protein